MLHKGHPPNDWNDLLKQAQQESHRIIKHILHDDND